MHGTFAWINPLGIQLRKARAKFLMSAHGSFAPIEELTAAQGRSEQQDQAGENKMLVVKPNPRRMRYMRDSPSENSVRCSRFVDRLRWERVFLAAGIAGVIVVGLIAVTAHH